MNAYGRCDSVYNFVKQQEEYLISTAMETGSVPLPELKKNAAKLFPQMRCFGPAGATLRTNYLALCAALASLSGHSFAWPAPDDYAWRDGHLARMYPLTESDELKVRALFEDAVSPRGIQKASFATVRDRMLTYCVGLQDLGLPAWCTTQIVIEATQPFGELARLHSVWVLVTRVKHWRESNNSS